MRVVYKDGNGIELIAESDMEEFALRSLKNRRFDNHITEFLAGRFSTESHFIIKEVGGDAEYEQSKNGKR